MSEVALEHLKDEVELILDRHAVIGAESWNTKKTLAHFTRLDGFAKMIADCRSAIPQPACGAGLALWQSDVSCLNDPLEGRALFDLFDRVDKPDSLWGSIRFDSEEWKILRDAVGAMTNLDRDAPGTDRRILVTSFTILDEGETERLDLWRAYGADGEGICLSMPLAEAVRVLDPVPEGTHKQRLYRVFYQDREKVTVWRILAKHILSGLEKRNPHDTPVFLPHELLFLSKVKRTCEVLFHLYKDSQYASEREARLVQVWDKSSGYADPDAKPFSNKLYANWALNRVYSFGPRFFLGVPGCKIVIGPKVKERERVASTISGLAASLWENNAPAILQSKIPYR